MPGEKSKDEVALDARQRAAIIGAAFDVLDLEELGSCGRGYRIPGDTGGHLKGVVGWPFMSWALQTWLDAGLLEVYAEADMETDEELRQFGWLPRAIPDRRWLVLLTADARLLLSDISLWGEDHATRRMHLHMSKLGLTLNGDDWIRYALASELSPPPLAQDRT